MNLYAPLPISRFWFYAWLVCAVAVLAGAFLFIGITGGTE